MTDLTLADIRAKYQDKLFPPPGGQPAPYFAGPGRKAAAVKPAPRPKAVEPSPAASLTADEILAAYDCSGSWGAAARVLGCSSDELRSRRRELGQSARCSRVVDGETMLAGLTSERAATLCARHRTWTAVAAYLGCSPPTLFKRLRELNIDIARGGPRRPRSDAEILAAWDQSGGDAAVTCSKLGMCWHSDFRKRLKDVLARAGR